MDALPESTVVWVAGLPSSEDSKRALEGWARAKGVRVSPAPKGRSAAIDLEISVRVESELAKAKDAILAGDADRAEARLAEAATLVRLHPELPHAPWLRAEVDRAWATRLVRLEPKDTSRAVQLLVEADGLDGGRVPAMGEPTSPPRNTIAVHFDWMVDARFQVRLDARAIAPGDEQTTSGDHHLSVTRNGALVWSAWVALAEGTPVIVPTPLPEPCSEDDLAAEKRSTVRCPRWITIREGADSLQVGECHGAACDVPLQIRLHPAPTTEDAHRRWPAWATWSIVGVAAVAIGTVGLVAGGAFEPASRETRFVNGGVRTSNVPIVSFR